MPVRAGTTKAVEPAELAGLVDEIIHSKRKTIAIIVHNDGRVVVRAPMRTPQRVIQAFVDSKREWIKEKRLLAARQVSPQVRKFEDGEKFLLLGKELALRVAQSQRAAITMKDDQLFIAARALPAAQAALENWYKAHAGKELTGRVQFFAGRHGFHYEKIRVSSARTRWGSCSSRGVLSFTWRLVMAPLDVIDYVVVHELAHLKIKNHSAVFWAEVARLMPDYKRRRDWLKKNGHLLTLDGVK